MYLESRYGNFQSVGLDKPNGSPPYTGCRFEVGPLGSTNTSSLARRSIKFSGHRPSNLGSLHVLGGPYGDIQSVGLEKPNGLPPYTGCLFEVDPLGSPKPPVKHGDLLSFPAPGPRIWVLYVFLEIDMAIFRVLGMTNLIGCHPILGTMLK